MRQLGFNAIPTDNLTVIYIPCYLNGDDGIINMPYYDVLPGLDVTVFPGYYEPWGYTPLESIAFGVPTVTTTLAGFGQWVLSSIGHSFAATGVEVVERTDSNYGSVCDHIGSVLGDIAHGKPAPAKLSQAARHTASQADWAHFIGLYEQAYAIAVANSISRNKHTTE